MNSLAALLRRSNTEGPSEGRPARTRLTVRLWLAVLLAATASVAGVAAITQVKSAMEPSGLACSQSKRGLRRSFGSDSGSTNQP